MADEEIFNQFDVHAFGPDETTREVLPYGEIELL